MPQIINMVYVITCTIQYEVVIQGVYESKEEAEKVRDTIGFFQPILSECKIIKK